MKELKINEPAKYYVMANDIDGRIQVNLEEAIYEKCVIHIGKKTYEVERIVIVEAEQGKIVLECKRTV